MIEKLYIKKNLYAKIYIRFKAIHDVTLLSGMKSQPTQDRQCMYKGNVEACLLNHCYHEKK